MKPLRDWHLFRNIGPDEDHWKMSWLAWLTLGLMIVGGGSYIVFLFIWAVIQMFNNWQF